MKRVCIKTRCTPFNFLVHFHDADYFGFTVVSQADEVETGGVVAHIQSMHLAGIELCIVDESSVGISQLHGYLPGTSA